MALLRTLYYLLRPRQRRIARRIIFFIPDTLDSIFRKRPPLVPPRGRIFTGRGGFVSTGDRFLELFISRCRLQPHHHVLDAGCGIGRIARPLAGFLDTEGRYDGFDIVEDGIQWCRKHYAGYPNFTFRHIPLKNDLYNDASTIDASNCRLPYKNNGYDLVVLVSVFTHMQPGEVRNYLNETARMLKPGGYCLATFFIFSAEVEQRYGKQASAFFPHNYGTYLLHDARVKNANIAFRLSFLEKMISDAGMYIDSMDAGWWPGRDKGQCVDFQDILVMKKE